MQRVHGLTTALSTVLASIAGASLLTATPAAAAQTAAPRLGAAAAHRVAEAAERAADQGGWQMVVTVVDAGGHPLVLHRMEGAQLGSIGVSLGKARTAAYFRRPSGQFGEWISEGRTQLLGLPGVVPVAGGLPLVVDGTVVGAIGISGATAAQDEQVARAAVAAFDHLRR